MFITQSSRDSIVAVLESKDYPKETFNVPELGGVADFAYAYGTLYVASGVGQDYGWDPVACHAESICPTPMAPTVQRQIADRPLVAQNNVQVPATPPPPYTPGNFWLGSFPAQSLDHRPIGMRESVGHEAHSSAEGARPAGGEAVAAPASGEENKPYHGSEVFDSTTAQSAKQKAPAAKKKRVQIRKFKHKLTGETVDQNDPNAVKENYYYKNIWVNPITNEPVDENFEGRITRGAFHNRKYFAKKRSLLAKLKEEQKV